MQTLVKRFYLAGAIGVTLLTAACASTEDLARVEGIANMALSTAQQAQSTANAASGHADQAIAAAQQAQATANAAQTAANAAVQEANQAHEEVRAAAGPRRGRLARGERG